MTTPAEFAREMRMTPDRAAEFAADIARLAEHVAPLVAQRLAQKEPKE